MQENIWYIIPPCQGLKNKHLKCQLSLQFGCKEWFPQRTLYVTDFNLILNATWVKEVNSVAYFREMLTYEQLEHATKSGVSVWNRSGPIAQPIKLEHFDWASRFMRSNLYRKWLTIQVIIPADSYALMVGLRHEAFVYMFTCLCSNVIGHMQFWYKQISSKQFIEHLCNVSRSDSFFLWHQQQNKGRNRNKSSLEFRERQ